VWMRRDDLSNTHVDPFLSIATEPLTDSNR
jgi:hypothetical protein